MDLSLSCVPESSCSSQVNRKHFEHYQSRADGRKRGTALLHKKLQGDLCTDDTVELLQALDYMPLAITQAAANISQRVPRITISSYLDNLRRSDKDRAILLKDVGDVRRDGRAPNFIIATWQISFEHIRKESPVPARLLSLMSSVRPARNSRLSP